VLVVLLLESMSPIEDEVENDDEDERAVHGEPLSFFRMHWDHEPALIPSPGLRPPSSPVEAGERGRFIESGDDFLSACWVHQPTPNPFQEGN